MKVQELFKDVDQLGNLIKLLKRECGPFLAAVDKPLFRGIKHTYRSSFKDDEDMGVDRSVRPMYDYYARDGLGAAVVLKGNVRDNRESKDSSSAFMAMYDNYFKDRFGYKARSQSLFTFFSEHTADQYKRPAGDVYMIFPRGEFKYIWSPYIADLFLDFEEHWGHPPERGFNFHVAIKKAMDELGIGDGDEKSGNLSTDDKALIMSKVLEDNPEIFLDSGLQHAARQYPEHEIMLKCKDYYAISVDGLDHEYDVNPREFMAALAS
jgi:hypothetical protein